MDLKLSNINYGELEIKNNDLVLETNRDMELVQMIAIMLKIRAGEIEFDISYGLDWSIFETGNNKLVEEEIRNKILYYFREVQQIDSISSEFSKLNKRILNVKILLTINNSQYSINQEVTSSG